MINIGKFLSRIVDTVNITRYRVLSKEWKSQVEGLISRIKTLSLTYSVCNELLQYDKKIYDENYYKRLMINRKLISNIDKYYQCKVPVISVYNLELDDINIPQYLVEERLMPDEYYIILSVILEYPSPTVCPIEIDVLTKLLLQQRSWLEHIILTMHDETALNNIVTFIPICQILQDESIKYICYANVVDTLLEEDFPMDHERFYITDSLDGLIELTNKIHENTETRFIPRNVASELTSFIKILINNN